MMKFKLTVIYSVFFINEFINVRYLYINPFVFECFIFDHVFQGPTGDQHIAQWATLGKYIEMNK